MTHDERAKAIEAWHNRISQCIPKLVGVAIKDNEAFVIRSSTLAALLDEAVTLMRSADADLAEMRGRVEALSRAITGTLLALRTQAPGSEASWRDSIANVLEHECGAALQPTTDVAAVEPPQMNPDRDRLLRLAEREDGCPIGVGGLMSKPTQPWPDFFVIERERSPGTPMYWVGPSRQPYDPWSEWGDIHHAMRWHTEQDAEDYLNNIVAYDVRHRCRVTQHMWIADGEMEKARELARSQREREGGR